MTNSKNLFITALTLIGGGYFILLMPVWLSYLLLGAVALCLLIHSALSYRHRFKAAWPFLREFFAFGLMATALTGTAVVTHKLLNVFLS